MVAHTRTESIRIELRGGFRVIVDGQAVHEGAWTEASRLLFIAFDGPDWADGHSVQERTQTA